MAKTVLIVDDSMLMRKMIADALGDDGWTVVAEAGDGSEAVAMYKEHQPTAVTLDIVMPDMNGMEALDRIRRFDPDSKVVVISALNQTRMISEAIRKGAQDFIAKPFLPEQLQQTVAHCFEEPVTAS